MDSLISQSFLANPKNQFVGGGGCCCGQFSEIFFPNLDFETGPLPPPGTFFVYSAGQNFGGWTVTRATIDHCDAGVGNLGAGNPNGASFFVDLHGSPGLGGISYDLFGLTPGNQYRIDFWTAQNGSGFSSLGNLKIAGGAWLDVSWIVSVSGSVSWRKESYMFMAMGTSASMEFSSTGPIPYQGTLVDDIHIFECPGDQEDPIVNNPQDDLEVACDKDVPKVPTLSVSDNCDPSPVITFVETKQVIDACSKKITRNWTIKDICGNITNEEQIIDVIDRDPPQFTRLPETKTVFCDKDVLKEFNDWIKKNGNALATDNCGAVNWRTNYDHPPGKHCDTILVEFIAIDHCGQENLEYAPFIVRDTLAPKFVIKAQNKNLVCVSGIRDSLRNWLSSYGFSSNQSDCDTIIKSSNFNGDSTRNPLTLTFYAKDACGNVDSCKASFSYRNNSDTFRITQYDCNFSGNRIDTSVYTSNGCDSVVITQQIKKLSDTTRINQFSCDPSVRVNDTVRLLNTTGCDSLVFYFTEIKPIDTTRLQVFDCNFINYAVDTTHFQGQFCDSIILIEKIPLTKDSIQLKQTTCDSSSAGVRILQFKNQFGCDSIVRIQIDYTGIISNFFTQMECGLLKNYVDTLTFSTASCDSLVITQHIALKIDTSYTTILSCDFSKTGVDTFIYQTSTCDSISIVNTLFLPSDTTRIILTSCNFSDVGQDTTVYSTSTCDSLVIINTLFIPSDTTLVTKTTCDYRLAGVDSIVFNTASCDSLVIVNTQFIPSDTSFISRTSCDVSLVGIDTLVYATNRCDSVVFLQTNWIPSDTIQQVQKTCLPANAGIDILFLKNKSGCDSILITNTLFEPLRVQFKLDSISCFDKEDGQIEILNTQDFQSPYTLYLDGFALGKQNLVDQLKPGLHELFIIDNQGCITDSIYFNLNNPPAFITELGNDLEVERGSLVKLELQTNRIWQHINWSPSLLIGCFDCNPVTFKAQSDQWIYTISTDERNCESIDSIFIHVKEPPKVYVPNGFSPNGDNINDFFYIQGDPTAIVELFQIFDRWGNLVFEKTNSPVNDPISGWDGTYKTEKMNPAVFIYVARIKFSNQVLVELKGDLSLIR